MRKTAHVLTSDKPGIVTVHDAKSIYLKLVSLIAPLYKLKYQRRKDRGSPNPQIKEANSQSDNFL